MTKQNVMLNRLSSIALLSFSSVAIIQMVSLGQLTVPLWCAVFFFAVAVPFLAANIYIIEIMLCDDTVALSGGLQALTLVGLLSAFVGIASLFAHFGLIAVGVFIAGTLGAVALGNFHIIMLTKTSAETISGGADHRESGA